MSMFDTPSKNATAGVEPTEGAARGFIEATADAYDAGFRAMSQFGVDVELARANERQAQKVFERTGKRDGHLMLPGEDGKGVSAFGGVGGLAAFYENGGSQEMADALAKHDANIEALRKAHPDLDLKNSRELWEQVKAEAVEAERKAEGRATFTGDVGHFLGGAAAGLDPRVNPFNTLTLGVGGFGRTVAQRIGTEVFGQGAIQVVNEATGVAENRRLLGLENGVRGSVQRVAQAAAFGGLIRGGVEGVAAALRPFRRQPTAKPGETPGSPSSAAVAGEVEHGLAPEAGSGLFKDFADFEKQAAQASRPKFEEFIADSVAHTTQGNLYGRSRLALARHEADILSVQRQLQDLRRDGPVRIGGEVALIEPPSEHPAIATPHWMKTADERVPEIARQADPELYGQLDKLDRMIAGKRADLAAVKGERTGQPTEALDAALAKADELEDQISGLRDQLGTADRRKVKRLQRKVAELEDEQRKVLEPHATLGGKILDTDARTAALSHEIAGLETQRRELGPLRRRAEDIAAQVFEDSRAKGETFEIMAEVMRRNLRIGEPETKPLLQTRRPSEKATEEQGGSNLTPGTPKRPGTTSGPNPEVKPADGSPLQRFTDDVAHENAHADRHVLAAFEAADAVKKAELVIAEHAAKVKAGEAVKGPAPKLPEEVVIGNRRYKLDDEIATGELLLDDQGKVLGLKMMKVRDVLKEFGDDADMLTAMKGCSI